MNTDHEHLTCIRSVRQQFWVLDIYLILSALHPQIAPVKLAPCVFLTAYILLKEKIRGCKERSGLSCGKHTSLLW